MYCDAELVAKGIVKDKLVVTSARRLRTILHDDVESLLEQCTMDLPSIISYRRLDPERNFAWQELEDDSSKMIGAINRGTFDEYSQSRDLIRYTAQYASELIEYFCDFSYFVVFFCRFI